MTAVRFLLNDRLTTVRAPAGLTALQWLRNSRASLGTKEGCAEGECGACAVLLGERAPEGVRYRAVPSCLLPLGELHGRHLITVEGLNPADGLTPVQRALVDRGAPQCGFCFPGIVMSLTGWFLTSPDLSVGDAADALDGNICRCTGYASILRAVNDLAETYAPRLSATRPRAAQLLDWGVLPAWAGEAAARLEGIAPPAAPAAGAVPLGGGTDLIVQRGPSLTGAELNFTARRPDLRELRAEAGGLRLGGAVTLEDLRRSPAAREAVPELGPLTEVFASTLVRNRATVAGNLVNASPIGDLTVLLLALGAELELSDGSGGRRLPLDRFYLGYKELDLRPGEIIHAVRVPATPTGAVVNFEKVSQRRLLDIASVNGAAVLRVDDGRLRDVRLACGGVAPVPLLLRETAAALEGRPATAASVLAAAEALDAEIAPIDDVRGSARYKRLLARRLLFAHALRAAPRAIAFQELVP